jgi:tRNA(Ile)-lysidine synthase
VRGGLIAATAPLAVPADFDRRLNGPVAAPVAVALSGGGDSVALLHIAKAWAGPAGRRLVALTVDHQLNPSSADWSRFAASCAARLGVAHRTLVWTGPKPATGLPAAARAARHALLAEAARAEGAVVVLMGHTADDLMEAELMRQAGARAAGPRAWSPSPAWPEGRGVFLLRPLLARRRADLRALLCSLGERWIEDPANQDLRSARARARRRLAAGDGRRPDVEETAPAWPHLGEVRQGVAGELVAPRAALAAGPGARRAIGALALCAAGTARPPPGAALDRIATRSAAGADFAATLAGARVEACGHEVRFCREAGERLRRGIADAALAPGALLVFDGRFEIATAASGHRIGFLAGRAARLPPDQRRRLARVPASARGALPAIISPDGVVNCPLLTENGAVAAQPLALQRLSATLGAICDEAALWRVAKLTRAS